MQEQQDYMEYRITQGRLAYEKWLRGRLLAEEEIYRESIRQRYVYIWNSYLQYIICRQRRLLAYEERQKRQQESIKAYEQWKARKSAEIKISQSTNREMTPPPRGKSFFPHTFNIM